MSDPQAPTGETGDHGEVDSSADTAAESSTSPGEHDATGTSEEQDPFGWPAEDPESTPGKADESGAEGPDPEWPEHDEAPVESTQRLEAVGRASETHAEGTGAGESGPDDPDSDPPTVQLAAVPPSVGEEPPSGGTAPPDERSAVESSEAAAPGSSGATRPADPADFGMPPGGASRGAPRLLGVAGARAVPGPARAVGDGGDGAAADTSAVSSGTDSSAETASTGEGDAGGGVGREPDTGTSRGDPPEVAGPGGDSGSGGGSAGEPGGKRARGRMGRKSVITAVSLVGVIVLGAAAVLGGTVWFGDVLSPRADAPAPVRLNPSVSGLDSSARMPTKQGLSRALEEVVSDPALNDLGGTVLDSRTGKVLWSRDADRSMVPASTNKLLTSCAALLAVDHDFRFSTKVVRGQDPGSVVLVGGGDPTLSALPEGRSSVYPDAARLDELVRKIRSSTSGEISSVKVDVSRYSGPTLAAEWERGDVANGYIAPVRPVMLDGGREDPTDIHSPRSEHPALDAARELASRLGAPTESVSTTTMRGSTSTLAEVRSPPLRDLVRKLLRDSDNVLAEAVARQVAVTTGHEPSFSGAVRAVRSVLERNGFDLSGVDLVDGSGLSDTDRLTPRLLGELLRTASAPADGPSGRSARLRPVLTAVPIAGASGSLAGRYDGPASEARGWVRAKTGTLTGANALAGTVVTADGRLLSFAFLSNGSQPNEARPALDRVAAKLRSCGCR
ncbi:D-alanyl-D-alanine carboxypeptidase/D-alanyl-D-alanine-endopeptidase (penicillin-binding protein 4) [Actinopolyspora biskrensis]|uniref:D-alanyl-D-alanine carboxypeptidase/D-alanyl-D-alanine-endopeptidase (Penicillin-binding protein 4) n=1 Tax=Actinopolyspora biskrensis TaxID=1470178 RepID=A0A852ZEX2_9ACTN|nr:D-alanyl-D-alanine carboxypeptidase/D-alanyl-D-alanine-endopeptidase [Actinopolyspora biskrensis]NYH80523.1 D-alanyl-D-alanine carboxypeptidase/D-alanyl-D-alanine-endopeptidase (penicillin-binding protein 4) [Actinopolyspora biskrensis]